MSTRLVYKQDVLDKLCKRDEALAMLTMPLATDNAGSSTTLRDTRLGRGTGQDNRFDGRIIEIVEDVDPGPEIGEIAGVDDGGFDQTDQLTFSPAMTNTVATSTDYLLYPRGVSPEMVNDALNEVLRNTEAPHLWFPSLVDDADFGENDLTNWAQIGTPTSRIFTEVAANTLFGERALYLATDAADEGATCDTFNIHDTETVLVSVLVRTGATRSCKVVLRNITASEDIRSVTIDEPAWTEIRMQETIPAACERIAVRFLSIAASDDFYVSPPVVVQTTGAARSYVLPSWFTGEQSFMEALYVPQGLASEDTYSYVALSKRARAAPRPTFLRDDRALNPHMVELQASSAGPVALVLKRTFDEMTADTDTSNADRQYVRDKAIANILRDQGEAEAGSWARKAAHRAQALGYGGRAVQLVENPIRIV